MNTAGNLDDYRNKLVDKILAAASHGEVERYLATAVDSLKRKSIHGHLIRRFVDKTINQLNELSLQHQGGRCAQNILYAKNQLEGFKRHREEGRAGPI